jgi:hypothetical protein
MNACPVSALPRSLPLLHRAATLARGIAVSALFSNLYPITRQQLLLFQIFAKNTGGGTPSESEMIP